MSILILALPADNAWISLGLPTQALIVGLLLQITRDFLLKANFILISIVTYIWIRKHRANLALSVLIVGGSIVFLPLLVAIILISSILSAPLLSLFTLPIFSSSFPRPQRFWPSLANYGSTYLKSTEETIYYQQAEPEIAKAVHRSLSRGAVPSEPGTQLLLRFDNRLALVSLLEMGEGFCTLNLRGLELQETSCHSEEATKVDDMVEALHNPRSRAQSALNINIFNTLSPVDSVVIATYSEARNVLTGIIDQSSSLHQFSSNLLHTLVWTFNRHISVALEKYPLPPPPPPPPALDSRHELEQKTTRSLDMISERVRGISPITGKPRGLSLSSGLNEDHSTSHLSTFIGEHEDTISWCSSIIGNELPPVHDKRSASLVADLQPLRETRRWSTDLPPVTRKVSATPPLRHFWIDSAHNLLPQDIPVPAESREDLSMLTTTDHKHSIPTTTDPIAPSVPTTTDPIPTSAPSSQHSKIGFLSNKVSPQHSEDCISPLSWPQPPLSEVNIFRLMENFPHEWLSYLNDGLSQDSRVFGVLSRTVVGCFFLLDVPASAQTTSSRAPRTYPLDIYKRFCGDVPRSLDLNWMTDNPKIWELALKAYRYFILTSTCGNSMNRKKALRVETCGGSMFETLRVETYGGSMFETLRVETYGGSMFETLRVETCGGSMFETLRVETCGGSMFETLRVETCGGSMFETLRVETCGGSMFETLRVETCGGSMFETLRVETCGGSMFETLRVETCGGSMFETLRVETCGGSVNTLRL